jgi:D-sedoheptulose 7-phosphate isomerase
MQKIINERIEEIRNILNDTTSFVADDLEKFVSELLETIDNGKKIAFIGNGGSAANAIHLANDFIYGAGLKNGKGLKVESLSANSAVITCLANDTGYENIYSEQIKVKGNKGDILVALSGSGNSLNIIKAIEMAESLEMNTYAILGFSGGDCKKLVKNSIHFPINDMQIAEDMQLIVGHMCMQWLALQNLSVS